MLRAFGKQITKADGVTLNPIAKPMLSGGAPSLGEFVISNFEFVIYLLFGICYLEFSHIYMFEIAPRKIRENLYN